MKERASKFLRNPAIVTLVVLAVVALGATSAYMVLEGWDFLTALIFTLATVTTIGYGNVYPEQRSAEIFTAWLMIVALAAVAVALSTYAARLIALVARGVNPMEQNERAIGALKNHVVLAAADSFANLLVQDLRAREMPFVAITQNEDLHDRWVNEGVPTVLGNPDDEEVLRQAGIERAAGLIVALPSDADNVFVSLSAHDLNPRLRIAAQAHTASAIPKLRRSGANEVVVPEQITALNLVSMFQDRAQVGTAVRQATDELREALAPSAAAETGAANRPRQVLFRALRLALQELSPGMESTLYAVGRQFGRDAMAPNLGGDGLCAALEGMPQLWSAAGLGEIRVVECSEDSARIEESECATCQGMPQVGRSVCHLERGVIAGALEAKLGRSVRTEETKCWGLGNGVCEFEVTADVDVH